MPSMISPSRSRVIPKRGATRRAPARPGAAAARVEDRRDLAAATRRASLRPRRVGALVDDVVHLAAERVERGDRAPPLRRQEQEAVVEARAAAARPCCWQYSSGVIADSAVPARHSMRSQSEPRSTGRWRNTSPRTRSIFSRMRRPPWTTMRISRPMRPGDGAAERGAGFQHRACARTWNASSSRHAASARARRCAASRHAVARHLVLRQVDAVLARGRSPRPARS